MKIQEDDQDMTETMSPLAALEGVELARKSPHSSSDMGKKLGDGLVKEHTLRLFKAFLRWVRCRSIKECGFRVGMLFYFGIILASVIVGGHGGPDTTRSQLATAGCAVLMVCWWVSEAIPLAVTALLPLVLFPLSGVAPAGTVSSAYFSDPILLFFGSFLMAGAVEDRGLHTRVALSFIDKVGTASSTRLLLSLMIATAFLSMWLNNTATAAMMMPLAESVLKAMEERRGCPLVGLGKACILGIAFSSSLGGMSSLTGTGPNIVLHGALQVAFPDGPEMSYGEWMLMIFPVAWGGVFALWGILCSLYLRVLKIPSWAPLSSLINENDESVTSPEEPFSEDVGARRPTEPLSYAEKVIAADFILLVLLWLLRAPQYFAGWSSIVPQSSYPSDGTSSMVAALILFLVPDEVPGGPTPVAGSTREGILSWRVVNKLPWDVIFLLGGGYALSVGFNESGLSHSIADAVLPSSSADDGGGSGGPSASTIVVVGTLLSCGLSNLVSNVATANIVLPLLTCVGAQAGHHPW